MIRGDRALLWIVALLMVIGLICVYSAGSFHAFVKYGDVNHFLTHQAMRVLVGVGAFVLCLRLNLRVLERWAPAILAIACVMLLVVIAMGHMSNGATRWLRVGFLSLQPTDLARLSMVVFLAWWLKHRPIEERGFWKGMGLPMLFVLVVAALILKQPNLSSAGLLLLTSIGILVLAGAPWRYLAIPGGIVVAVASAALALHPYMMKRVNTFLGFILRGELDKQGAGYQLDQSLIAIGSGGLIGRGPGGSLQKFNFLPEAHTDFIFSITAEEWGLVGATVLFVLLALLVWRGLRIAARAKDPFHALLAGGITIQIGMYAVANLAVATGLAPTTGLPLPFISYGGSALMVNAAAIGLLYRVSTLNDEADALTRQRWSREAR